MTFRQRVPIWGVSKLGQHLRMPFMSLCMAPRQWSKQWVNLWFYDHNLLLQNIFKDVIVHHGVQYCVHQYKYCVQYILWGWRLNFLPNHKSTLVLLYSWAWVVPATALCTKLLKYGQKGIIIYMYTNIYCESSLITLKFDEHSILCLWLLWLNSNHCFIVMSKNMIWRNETAL